MPPEAFRMPLVTRSTAYFSLCVCLVLALVLVSPPTALAEQTEIPPEEYAALEALYAALGGEGWTIPWTLPTEHPCPPQQPGAQPDLPGVYCYQDHVVSLNLQANGLSGSIPEAVGDLTHVHTLDLSENGISGEIPSAVGGILALQTLDLRGNQLTGEIPAALGSLTGLTELDLSGNQLSGSIPADLGGLSNLRTLSLSTNALSGELPAALGDLAALQWFLASDNDLSGAIPEELGRLTNLWGLALRNNSLNGEIPSSLGSLGNLSSLDLSDNDLSGEIPAELGNLTRLSSLSLGNNRLSGPIPAALGNLHSLAHLYLFSNELSGPIPEALGDMAGLQVLSLPSNQLEGPIPEALSALTDLRLLSLAENRLSGEIPAFLGDLTGLYWLDLGYNALSGPVPASLSNLTGLTWFQLDHNMLWTDDPTLAAFLEEQDPYWSTTQTLPPTNVQATPVGRGARVTWTPGPYLSGSGHYEVGVATAPGGPYTPATPTATAYDQEVTIRGLEPGQTYYLAVRAYSPGWGQQQNDLLTAYSEDVPVVPDMYDIPVEEYEALVALYEATDGAHWATSWSLPADDPCSLHGVVCSAGHITRLQLAGNGLQGALPDALFGLTELVELDLHANSLSGAIPAAIGSLTRLTTLRLDANALHGPLPVAMGDLTRLSSLNLGYNILWTDDPALAERLGVVSPSWERTQTVPPTEVVAESLPGGARLSWRPGPYRVDGGYYEAGASLTAGGPYTPLALTEDQAACGIDVTGLESGVTYYLAVRAHSPAQGEQVNALTSPYGAEVRVMPPYSVALPWVCR